WMRGSSARSRASSTRFCPRMTGLDKPFKLSANARLRARRTRKGKTEMAQQRLGIIMNGVTGRMGTNQHLVRSILAIRAQDGIKHGVVQDKLFLPGLLKLKMLIDSGFFGRILAVRGEFGYWVFEGDWQPAQRPSWNYRKKDGGGIILDMLCHWRYVLDNLFGEVKSVSCLGATHIPKRWDENGKPYKADVDDAAYATFQLANGVIAQFNSSWCVRVRRDD